MIDKIIAADHTYTEDQDIADILNEHFSSIGDKIASKIQPSPYDFFLNMPRTQTNFSFSLVTPCIIKKIIMSLKNKKPNMYNYSVAVLKHISDLIAPVLTKLLNLSLLQGSVLYARSLGKLWLKAPFHVNGKHPEWCQSSRVVARQWLLIIVQ